MKKAVFCFVFSLLLSTNAMANLPEIIGQYGDWQAYYYKDTVGDVCYIVSQPKKEVGKYTIRGDVYAIVTHRRKEKSFDVINFDAGYKFKPEADFVVKIGTTVFKKFFTSDNTAWAINEETEKQLIESMKKGERMIVHGVSARGTKTTDTYSLKGFTAAYKAISAKCKKHN